MLKTILVTGGAGFIGSNLVRALLAAYPKTHIVTVDLLTYAGSLANLTDVTDNPRHNFVQADIRNPDGMRAVFDRYRPDAVMHLAAQSHVDRSIHAPDEFVQTNVYGTQVLLNCARRAWCADTDNAACTQYQSGCRFLYVSTDEVYGSAGESERFTEQSPLAPRNPYSASKAAAELFVRASFATYGLPVVITRSCNNYGPYQHAEKLIPRMVYAALTNHPLPVYGDGLQVREWVSVHDHCAALLRVLAQGQVGEIYNIGGGQSSECTNLAMINMLTGALGIQHPQIDHIADRPGHDRRYALNCAKITTELGWHPTTAFADGIRETALWYSSHYQDQP